MFAAEAGQLGGHVMTPYESGFSALKNNRPWSAPDSGRVGPFRMPHAVGAAALAAAGCCAAWLRASDWLPAFSPLRTLCLMAVCGYLVAAALLLLDDR
jgi:hypothetical protein